MKRLLGLSLLELLTALLILSTLLSISLPNFSETLLKKKGEVTLRKLASAIQLAKSSAIASGHLVTICRSSDGLSCGGEWRHGVILFTDENGDQGINDRDKLLGYVPFTETEGKLSFRAFQNKQYLQITSLGFTRSQNGNFTYCPDNGRPHLANQLILNRTARLRYAVDSNGDGIKEDSQGKPIRCD